MSGQKNLNQSKSLLHLDFCHQTTFMYPSCVPVHVEVGPVWMTLACESVILRHFLCRQHFFFFAFLSFSCWLLSELMTRTLLTGNYQGSHQDVCSYKCALQGEFHVQGITHNPSPLTMLSSYCHLNTDKNPQGNSYAGGISPEHECCYLLFDLILSCAVSTFAAVT